MNKQLYVKNDKGRYEPYREPPVQDNKLYCKINGKYKPWGMELRSDTLNEGVWVVTRRMSCKSIISGKYLKDIFCLDKCSNLEKFDISLSKLGSLQKLCDTAITEIDCDGLSVYEAFYKRMSYVIDKLVGESKEEGDIAR